MKKRLPLVLVALLGVFLWRGGFGLLPVERTISWKLWGEFSSIRRVELQLYQGEALLQRTVLEPPTGEPTTKISLKQGTCRGLMMIYRADAGSPEVRDEKVLIDGDSSVVTIP